MRHFVSMTQRMLEHSARRIVPTSACEFHALQKQKRAARL